MRGGLRGRFAQSRYGIKTMAKSNVGKTLRIVVITSPFGELPPISIGAVEKLYYLLGGVWKAMGHSVTFICCGGGEGMDCVRLKKYNRTGSTLKDLFWDFLYSVKVLCRCPTTDILLCNTFWSPVLAPLFRWKYKRLTYAVHRIPKGQFWLYPFVHGFVCVSTVVAAKLREQVKRAVNIVVINDPIDAAVFHPLAKRQSTSDFVVVYAGRIHPEKGLDILFKAAEQFNSQEKERKIKLKIIGTADKCRGGGGEDYVKRLESLAPNVATEWVGAVSDPRQLAEKIAEGDCFVYPSVAAKGETFGVAPLEAMALGLPTILSNLDCFSDYAAPGVNAIQITLGKEEVTETVKALHFIRNNPDKMKALADNAAQTAARFSQDKIAEIYIDWFCDLLSNIKSK